MPTVDQRNKSKDQVLEGNNTWAPSFLFSGEFKLHTFLKLHWRCPAENLTCFSFRDNSSHQARILLFPYSHWLTRLHVPPSRLSGRGCPLRSHPTLCPQTSAPRRTSPQTFNLSLFTTSFLQHIAFKCLSCPLPPFAYSFLLFNQLSLR